MTKALNTLHISFSIILLLFLVDCTSDPMEIAEPDKSPPQAMILYPANGESVKGEIIIQVRSVDNDEVDSVIFLINQEKVSTDSSHIDNVFSYRWDTEISTMENGELIKKYAEDEFHYISVIAFDPYGNSYASAPILVKIDNIDNEAPTGFILSPFAGQNISSVVNIEVIATDNDSIQYVSYFINNVLQGYVQESPYVFPWNTNLVESGNFYSLHANVKDMNDNITTIAPISVFVDNGVGTDITPPTGAIVSPPAGLIVSGEVQIIISANDNRAMGEVALSIDGEYIETIQQEPYYYSWDTAGATEDEEHIISVVLIDLAGNESTLNPIAVTVDNFPEQDTQPPTLTIFSPVPGQTLNGVVNIEINAIDESGIDHVEFIINGEYNNLIDSIAPYVYEWDTENEFDDIQHWITAIGFDVEGNQSLAPPIYIYVDNNDNIIPNGTIVHPIPGQTVSDTVNIEISATDNVGIDHVTLSINNIIRDTLYNYPYSYSWNTNEEIEDESHNISAVAYDSSGNFSPIGAIVVFVDNELNDNSPPTGIIASPISGQTVSGIVDFNVIAQDDTGISEVIFYIDGENVHNSNSEPYTFEWNTASLDNNSEHTLSATLTDDVGNITILQPILVTISN